MADLLIKGMEMPSGCINPQNGNACPIILYCICGRTHPLVGERGADCPLVEVPTHGELVDRDNLLVLMADEIIQKGGDERSLGIAWAHTAVELAPTVIEASEDGEQDEREEMK